MKLIETDTILAFMDIGPIARGHCLVIPKCTCVAHEALPLLTQLTDHAAKLTDLPDDQMGDILPALKKLAKATVCLQRQISSQTNVPKGCGELQHSSGWCMACCCG